VAQTQADGPSITIDGDPLVVSASPTPIITGTTSIPEAVIQLSVGQITRTVTADASGRWRIRWAESLETGTYEITARVVDATGRVASVSRDLRVEIPGRLPRRPLVGSERDYATQPEPDFGVFQPFTDRWRVVPPDYELTEKSRGRWDPYNQNILKADFPIIGQDIFLSLAGISDSLVEGRRVPSPSGVSADDAGARAFFGEGDQGQFNQNVTVSADLFKGLTTFQPAAWRVRATITANFNHVEVRETAIVNPDVRRGTDRSDGQLGLQEIFYERLIRPLSVNYDFVSVRAGVQPFVSDFRGFVFSDTNLGVRLFGSLRSNRYQYNLAYFDRLEKDTNSGLNIWTEFREQQVAVANVYRQDTFLPGYTVQGSVHWFKDDASVLFDSNDILVRPDPIGDFVPHEVEATYLGIAGFGKINRVNIDHAMYYAFGEDSHNPIAGFDELGGDVGNGGVQPGRESVDISAWMAAAEISIDRDWLRPRFGFFATSGDDDVRDRDANGFAAIFPNPNFAGGGFSFWNRLGIRLAGTGVGLVHRGSLIPDLNSSKDEGQPNFVNPGIHLLTTGLDIELTQKMKLIFTANYLRFAEVDVLRAVLYQRPVRRDIGVDVSAGMRYRPFLNNNVVVLAGVATLIPGEGFKTIYEDDDPLYQFFTNLILSF
jgi:hypothetical protein